MATLKIVSAHQSAYLPWPGYFHKIILSDVFVILDNVQFEKNSFTNRNKIKTPQGPLWLTVPVLLKGHTTKTMADMEINNNTDWKEKHWKTIQQNYKKAPSFANYSNFFEELYKNNFNKLWDINFEIINFFLKEFKINTEIVIASELTPKGHKNDFILDICKKCQADVYISGVLGRDYLDEARFEAEGIKVIYQSYNPQAYPQIYGDFIPCLSAIDMLFNCGENSRNILMKDNLTKEEILISGRQNNAKK